MNVFKTTLLSSALFFGLSGTVLMAGCEADPCLDLKCQSGGSCAEGFCRCPSGYEGAECEFRTADRFLGTFRGIAYCDSTAKIQDTVTIFMRNAPSEVGLVRYQDSVGTGRDTLYGTVIDRRINFADVTSGNYRRYAHATISDKNMTFYEETIPDVSTNIGKNVCTFTGDKIAAP